jgi:hypothetical protein
MPVTINGTTGISNDGGYTGDGVVFADATPANTLVTTTGGNVGIGTSSPAYPLDVVAAQIRQSSNSVLGTRMTFESTSTNGRRYQIGSNFYLGTGEFAVYDETAGAGRFVINSAGIVTTPYQVAWSADFAGFTLTNAGQIYYPSYNTPEINVGGHFNASTGRMTAPVSGVYLLMGSFLRNSNSAVYRGRFYKNGVTQTDGELRTTEAFSGYNDTNTFTQMIYASAGDTLGFGVACDTAGNAIYAAGYNYFAGYLLG